MDHQPTDPIMSNPSATLSDEHVLLLAEVTSRSAALLVQTDQDRWPQRELHVLLDYLHLEVLRQIVDEEWLLFRDYHDDPQDLDQLCRDHLELRRMIETLADVAGAAGPHVPAELAATTRNLVAKLGAHIAAEEQVLGGDLDVPSPSGPGRIPHAWYALTDGPLLDLDELRGPQGVDAALGRLLRLHRGGQVDLQASTDPLPIWRRLAAADPHGYGFDYLQQGPPRWRVRVTRRSDS